MLIYYLLTLRQPNTVNVNGLLYLVHNMTEKLSINPIIDDMTRNIQKPKLYQYWYVSNLNIRRRDFQGLFALFLDLEKKQILPEQKRHRCTCTSQSSGI